jgi:hypothetical protein
MKLYPDDWKARLTTAAVTWACMAAVWGLGSNVGITGFWPFMLSIVVGIVLGQRVGRALFPPTTS